MKPKKYGMNLILASYWRELKHYPHFFIPLLLLVPLAVFLNSFALPYVASEIINILSTQGQIPLANVWTVFGRLILLFVVASILGELIIWLLIVWLIWNLEMRVEFRLYTRCVEYLTKQSLQFHADRFGGTLVSQANKFASSYIRLSDSVIFQILPFIFTLLFTFIILGQRVPLFTLSMIAICTLFIVLNFASYHRIRHLNEIEAISRNKLSGYISDIITNIMAVKIFSAEKNEINRFQQLNRKARNATKGVMIAVTKRDIGFGIGLCLLMTSMILFIVYGQALFTITIGTMILMLTYSMNLFSRLWDIMHITRNYNRIYGNALPMAKLLHTKIIIRDPKNPEPVQINKGAINFDNVSFTHDDDDTGEKLFANFNLSILPGEKVGLIGHSGSGKTTLTKLLLRFMDVDKGKITIDGQNITKIKQADLRRHIAYVPQEPMLFHRSIRDNIAYGKPNASENEMHQAAKKAYADEFIKKLPQGYDTIVGERGVKLSGGQRQRIAIARAILKDAPILILDEATSALDSESELLIQNALRELMKDRTAIVIAHRLSTIQNMDHIVVLQDGTIVEQGSHDQLLAKDNTYAKLWSHQSGRFI